MGTWYVGSWKWDSTFCEQLGKFFTSPEMWSTTLQFREESSAIMARIHGNPLLDSCDIGRQDSPATMRDQLQFYRKACVTGQDAFELEALMAEVSTLLRGNQGLHIIDADDPLLVEHGEAHVHKQFCDYLAEPMTAPKESQEAWVDPMHFYTMDTFVRNLVNGYVPPALILEIGRQALPRIAARSDAKNALRAYSQ
jgi:hypothetical protein